MKTVRSWFKLILCFTTPALLASCASTYTPTESSVAKMTYAQAWTSVNERVKHMYGDVAEVRISPSHVFVLDTSGNLVPVIRNLSKITKISLINFSFNDDLYHSVFITEGDGREIKIPMTKSPESQRELANAIYFLHQNAIQQQENNKKFVEMFSESLPGYRNQITANVELPEAAHKYMLQAEGAARAKDFYAAAGYFRNVTDAAPWWPPGYFNRAFVLGEIGYYQEAMMYMKCYLKLAPDAPDARAAQNKIYEWERLESL